MRTVYVDAGPIAHLTGKGSLKGHSMLDSEALVSPKGMGIVVQGNTIESISSSEELVDEYGLPDAEQSSDSEIKIIISGALKGAFSYFSSFSADIFSMCFLA